NPHALDKVLELPRGEGVDGGGDFGEGAVGLLFGEIDFDVEFDFTPHGGRVKENLVRGDAAADTAAGDGGECFAGVDEPLVRLPGDPLVPFALLEVAELGQPFVEAARGTKQAVEQLRGRRGIARVVASFGLLADD